LRIVKYSEGSERHLNQTKKKKQFLHVLGRRERESARGSGAQVVRQRLREVISEEVRKELIRLREKKKRARD